MVDRRARLEAELRAIKLWDEAYSRDNAHDPSDEFSFQARQLRRREIMREVQNLTDSRSAVQKAS